LAFAASSLNCSRYHSPSAKGTSGRMAETCGQATRCNRTRFVVRLGCIR
jgi:hypothetical protein